MRSESVLPGTGGAGSGFIWSHHTAVFESALYRIPSNNSDGVIFRVRHTVKMVLSVMFLSPRSSDPR